MPEELTLRLFDPSSYGIKAQEFDPKVEYERQERVAPAVGEVAVDPEDLNSQDS